MYCLLLLLLFAVLQYTSLESVLLVYLKSALKLCVLWILLVCLSKHLIITLI